jgi:hypothetical protein
LKKAEDPSSHFFRDILPKLLECSKECPQKEKQKKVKRNEECCKRNHISEDSFCYLLGKQGSKEGKNITGDRIGTTEGHQRENATLGSSLGTTY